MTGRLRLVVLYDHGPDLRPHSSPHLRLYLPLTHPTVARRVHLTYTIDYHGEPADAVIVDRLWRHDVAPEHIERLADAVRRRGARLLYALDDNLLDLGQERPDWPERYSEAVARLAERAAGVLVTTAPLRERLRGLNAHIAVVPNALDERLIAQAERYRRREEMGSTDGRRIVLGYMGTPTHDADLLAILPALAAVAERFGEGIELQLVGGIGQDATLAALAALPLAVRRARTPLIEYAAFLPWFCSLGWDIGLAPLRATPFNDCKSDIKMLDYAAMGAAGVFSEVPAYAATVRHRETGWLAAETVGAWVEALEALVGDGALRTRLAGNARALLLRERTLAHRATDVVDAIEQLMAATPAPRAAPARPAATGPRAATPAGAIDGDGRRAPPDEGPAVRLHVVYPAAAALRPGVGVYRRLLRPLSHPALAGRVALTHGTGDDLQGAGHVLLYGLEAGDRDLVALLHLLERARRAGQGIVYAPGEDLPDLRRLDDAAPERQAIVRALATQADGILVTGDGPVDGLAVLNPRLAVVADALDERLLGQPALADDGPPFAPARLVVGYRGADAHLGQPAADPDLALVLPALAEVTARFGDRLEVQVAAQADQHTLPVEGIDLPVHWVSPRPHEWEYPLFLLWFSHRLHWDIALAPYDCTRPGWVHDSRHLDHAAIGAATLASRTARSEAAIDHAETGWLVENTMVGWVEALERLLLDAELRRRLARNAYRRLVAEHILAHRAADWLAALGTLLPDGGVLRGGEAAAGSRAGGQPAG